MGRAIGALAGRLIGANTKGAVIGGALGRGDGRGSSLGEPVTRFVRQVTVAGHSRRSVARCIVANGRVRGFSVFRADQSEVKEKHNEQT